MRDNKDSNTSSTNLANLDSLTAGNTASNAGSTAMLYGGGNDVSGIASGAGQSRPPYSRSGSTDRTATSVVSASSSRMSDLAGEDEDGESAGGGIGRERNVFGEAFETPRRRRSSRLFSHLRGFTPI